MIFYTFVIRWGGKSTILALGSSLDSLGSVNWSPSLGSISQLKLLTGRSTEVITWGQLKPLPGWSIEAFTWGRSTKAFTWGLSTKALTWGQLKPLPGVSQLKLLYGVNWCPNPRSVNWSPYLVSQLKLLPGDGQLKSWGQVLNATWWLSSSQLWPLPGVKLGLSPDCRIADNDGTAVTQHVVAPVHDIHPHQNHGRVVSFTGASGCEMTLPADLKRKVKTQVKSKVNY